jgi:hypothetical protein
MELMVENSFFMQTNCTIPGCKNNGRYCRSHSPVLTKEKKPKPIAKKSEKKIQEEKLAKGSDEAMDRFFEAARKRMTGFCQCGCTHKSSKNDDTFYRHSIAHIFPKRIFKSIATHPLNWVERAFFGGCHSAMDDTSMDRWPNFADFEDIKERFHLLVPHLTDEERATKFYSKLESLVYSNVINDEKLTRN